MTITTWLRDFLSGGFTRIVSMPVWLSFIIDVAAVSYAIFKVMGWIRQTRAWPLFKGFMVIVIIYIVAMMLNMVTVQWMMKATFSVGLITVVILFQPELRKALEQLGNGRFYKPFINSDSDKSAKLNERGIGELLFAIAEMAKAQTGALIVVEQDVPLGDHEQTGTIIDAVVTSRLLLNIFEHNTPLHDGAVLIRNNRIAAAQCILPLTQKEIGPDLGTRHRAAVGMSEVSDAVVIVVSEETGKISAAYNGTLKRGLELAEVRAMLEAGGVIERRSLISWRKKRGKTSE